MARGITLEQLVTDLRAEIGQSTNSAVSRASVDMLKTTLRRVQERLWLDFTWPHLKVTRDVVMQDNERYYDFPDDLDLTRIDKVEVKFAGRWIDVKFGIGKQELDTFDSDLGIKNDPVRAWDYYNGEQGDTSNQFQVWPIPANNGDDDTKELCVRFHGIKTLRSLVSMADVCDLDGWLLVLYSASEILARLKAPDAPAKLEAANLYYARLKDRYGTAEMFTIGGDAMDKDKDNKLRLRVAYADQNGTLFS